MEYRMYLDGNLFYQYGDRSLDGIIDPTLKLEINKAGTLDFTILPNHPRYGAFQKLTSIVTVMEDDEVIFRGRPITIKTDFFKQSKISCEGDLTYLLDTVIPPTKADNVTVGSFFRTLIAKHNAQVATDPDKEFRVGQITIEDKDVVESFETTSFQDTSSAIDSEILQAHGGILQTRVVRPNEGNEVVYIDLLSDSIGGGGGSGNIPTVEFGKNLLDFEADYPVEDVFSVLVPIGKSNLTIESVNGGSMFLESTEAIAKFGRIVHTETWSDVEDPSTLLAFGQAYMAAHGRVYTDDLTVKAVDMNVIDGNYPKIKMGEAVNVISDPHGIKTQLMCLGMELHFQNPENNSYELGTFIPADRHKKEAKKASKSGGRKKSGGSGKKSKPISSKVSGDNDTTGDVVSDLIGSFTGDLDKTKKDFEIKANKLDADIKTVDFKAEKVTADVGTLNTKVGTLNTTVGTMTADIGTLNTTIGTATVDINTLKTTIGNWDLTAGTISGKIGTMDITVEDYKQISGDLKGDHTWITQNKDEIQIGAKAGKDAGAWISVTGNAIKGEVYNSEGKSIIKQTADAITATVGTLKPDGTYSNWSQLTLDAKNIKAEVYNSEGKSIIKQTADAISSTINAVDKNGKTAWSNLRQTATTVEQTMFATDDSGKTAWSNVVTKANGSYAKLFEIDPKTKKIWTSTVDDTVSGYNRVFKEIDAETKQTQWSEYTRKADYSRDYIAEGLENFPGFKFSEITQTAHEIKTIVSSRKFKYSSFTEFVQHAQDIGFKLYPNGIDKPSAFIMLSEIEDKVAGTQTIADISADITNLQGRQKITLNGKSVYIDSTLTQVLSGTMQVSKLDVGNFTANSIKTSSLSVHDQENNRDTGIREFIDSVVRKIVYNRTITITVNKQSLSFTAARFVDENVNKSITVPIVNPN